MKTIKKTDWRYKLILRTFFRSSKTTCEFYLDLLLSIISYPLTFYENTVFKIELVDEKEKESRPAILGIRLGVAAISLVISTFLTAVLTIPASNYIGLHSLLFDFISLAGMFIYPAILFYVLKIHKKLKEKICVPIDFVE